MSSSPTGNASPIVLHDLAKSNGWTPNEIGRSCNGVPIMGWWPTGTPTRIVCGAIHGEEAVTLQPLHQMLQTVSADDACAVIVPVVNPDGVLAGTRQNARGVDLNRNFPGHNWLPKVSPTFWPTTTIRTPAHRTLMSSPGASAGSEPETQAIISLVEQIKPQAVIDFHTPLDLIIAAHESSHELAHHLAEPAKLRVVTELAGPTPGDIATWVHQQGSQAVSYEFEMAPMHVLWARHQDAVVRSVVDRLTAT